MEPKLLEAGWMHAVRLWWSYTWRSFIYFLITLVPIALLVTMFASSQTAVSVMMFLGWPVMIGAQIFAFSRLLRLEYKGFRVRVLEPNTTEL